MTTASIAAALFSFSSIVFLLMGLRYRTKEREIFEALENDGTLFAFTTLGVQYLRGQMRPEGATEEEFLNNIADLRSMMAKIAPGYDASRTANRYIAYSIVCIVMLIASGLVAVFGY